MYTLYYVGIVGSTVSLRCKSARVLFLLFLCLWKGGIISEKKCPAGNDYGYVYIIKHRCGIHIYYLLCEHPTSFVEASKKTRLEELNNNISDRSVSEGSGVIVGYLCKIEQNEMLLGYPH